MKNSSDVEANTTSNTPRDEMTPMIKFLNNASSSDIGVHEKQGSVQMFDLVEPEPTLTPIFKILLLFLQKFSFITWTPIVTQFVLYNPVSKRKETSFLPQSPYVIEFFISVIIANFMSWCAYGTQGFAICWDHHGIRTFLPVSVFHGTSVCLQLISMVPLDGISRSVLDQFKLPFIVLLGFIFFKRTLSMPRVFSLITLVLAGIGFVLNKYTEEQLKVHLSPQYFTLGLPLGFITSLLSVIASLVLDNQMKHHTQTPYISQIAQLRTSSFIIVTLGLIIQAYARNQLNHLLFQGWNFKVLMLVFWLVAKDYSTIFLLKRLTALHLALCTSAALCSTYILDILFFQHMLPGVHSWIFISIIAFSIATYGSVGQLEQNFKL